MRRLSNQRQRRALNYYSKKPKVEMPEEKIRMYFKSGNSTMLIAKLSRLAAESLGLYIERYCKKHDSKLEGLFILTR